MPYRHVSRIPAGQNIVVEGACPSFCSSCVKSDTSHMAAIFKQLGLGLLFAL